MRLESLIATVTHAKLRAAQGDLAGARRILQEILRVCPDHSEARELYAQYSGRCDSVPANSPAEVLPPPEPADASSLADAFRRTLAAPVRAPRPEVERLRAWLTRISDRSS